MVTSTKVRADTTSLRMFTDRSSELTAAARSSSVGLSFALWTFRNSSSEYVGQIPDLDGELRSLLGEIDRADFEARTVAVKFEATQIRVLQMVATHFGRGGAGFRLTPAMSAGGGGHPFAVLPPRRTMVSAQPAAQQSLGGPAGQDPATIVVATGREEVKGSVAVALGVGGSAIYEWEEYADGHIVVTETVDAGVTAGLDVGADVGAWKTGGGATGAIGVGGSVVHQQTYEVQDDDELRLLIQHRLLDHAIDGGQAISGLAERSAGAAEVGGALGWAASRAWAAIPPRLTDGMETLADRVVGAIDADLSDVIAYEPDRSASATGVQVDVSAELVAAMSLVEDQAGVALSADATGSVSVMWPDAGGKVTVVSLAGLGDAYLGAHGLQLSGSPVGVAASAGASMNVTSVEGPDGEPIEVVVDREVQIGDRIDVDSVSYDLTDPEQMAEATAIESLASGDVTSAAAAVRLTTGVFGGRRTAGTVTRQTFHVSRDKNSLGGKVALGGKAEARITHESERRTPTG